MVGGAFMSWTTRPRPPDSPDFICVLIFLVFDVLCLCLRLRCVEDSMIWVRWWSSRISSCNSITRRRNRWKDHYIICIYTVMETLGFYTGNKKVHYPIGCNTIQTVFASGISTREIKITSRLG